MRATLKYDRGLHFSGDTESGHTMHWDSGGTNEKTAGPTPMEGVLQAGASCSAMDVVAILRKRRKLITLFEVDVEAERSDEHPRVFTSITITYRIAGDGITYDEVEKAVTLSQERYCSVLNMLKPNVEVFYNIEMK